MSRYALYGIFLQCLVYSFMLASESSGQRKSIEEIHIVVELKKTKLIQAFKSVEQATDFKFAFKSRDLPNKMITLDGRERSLGEVLRLISSQTGLGFKRVDNTISVKSGQEAVALLVRGNGISESYSEDIKVNGRVASVGGEGVPGVNIIEKGTTNGTISDLDGNYSLKTSDNATLVFSSVGYHSQEVEVSGRNEINIELIEDVKALDEIVVVGYGTQKRTTLTSSVAEIGIEEIQGKTNTDTRQMIQGVASGVAIIDAGGGPGENSINIRVRGTTTIGNNEPLIFVNGIEQNFADLNPDNIESITVLKDASATAIYGSRAANGVIIVTTKKPVAQTLSVNYHGSFGFEQATNLPAPMGLEAYMRLQNFAEQSADLASGGDGNVLSSTYGRPFTEEMINHWVTQNANPDSTLFYPTPGDYFAGQFQTGSIQNHRISIGGGSDQMSSRFSLQWVDQDGIMLQSNHIRKEVRFDNTYQPVDWINISASVTYRRKDVDSSRDPGGFIEGGYHGTPWSIPQYPDGSFGMNPRNNNATMRQLIDGDRKIKEDYFVGNVKTELDLTKNLKFTTQYGGFTDNRNFSLFTPKWKLTDPILGAIGISAGRNRNINSLQENRTKTQRYTWRNLLNYSTSFGKHEISALAGHEQQWYDRTFLSNSRENFYSNDLTVLGAGAVDNQSTDGTFVESRLRSYFGRLNYAFDERYLFEVSFRNDGSSLFTGSKNQFGFFPSFSLAWNMSNESFWEPITPTISDLKLRGSWGQTGANTVAPYSFFSGIDVGSNYSFGGVLAQTAAVTGLINSNLTWETTTQWNVGFDTELFEGALNFTFEYWNKQTEGILLGLPVPATVGFSGPVQNAGRVDNRGWDFSLAHKRVVNDKLSYQIRANLSDFNNEVVDLQGTGPYIGGDNPANSDVVNVIAEGSSLNSMWGYVADGLYELELDTDSDPFVDNALTLIPETLPGSLRYVDVNNDGQITAADKTIIGDEDPHYTYGITADLQYNQFDFSIFIQGVGSQDRMPRGAIIECGNWLGYTVDACSNYWTPENQDAFIPRPQKRSRHNGVDETLSSHWVIDASYIRLKNIQLGYTLPQNKLSRLGISNLRFYISGTNLWWSSNAKEWGVDPEVRSGRLGFYPQTRQFVLGAMIGL